MTTLFFISGHGFGHASRQVEIVNALGAQCPGLRVLIRSEVSAQLLRRTLRVPYELRPGACDTGIVQRTSVEHDDAATVEAAVAFYSGFEARVAAEVAALGRDRIDLVVGDIPPLAFEVAKRREAPSVAIGNFTWDWIYETHPGMSEAAPWLVPLIRRSYASATSALELPFGCGFDVFPSVRAVPLVARRPTRDRADTRAFFGVPLDRPAALLSFGGYGIPDLDLTRIDARDWTLLLTDRVAPADPQETSGRVVHVSELRFQDSGFRYEDVVAAVDVVVSKPGYGIVSECIACGTPLLYTSRGAFREYDMFVREMPRFLRCRFIDQRDLFGGRWRTALDALASQPAPAERLATNGAEVAAATLASTVA